MVKRKTKRRRKYSKRYKKKGGRRRRRRRKTTKKIRITYNKKKWHKRSINKIKNQKLSKKKSNKTETLQS